MDEKKKFNLTPVTAKQFELAPVGPEAFTPENLGGVQPDILEEPEQPEKRAGFWGNLNKKFGATIYDMAKGITELPQWQEATQNTYVKGLARAYLNRQVKKGKVDANEAEKWKSNMDEWIPKMGFLYPVQPGKETLGEKIAESGVNQWLGKTAEQLRTEGNRYDKSVTDYLKNKEWGKAFGAEITGIVESTPYTIAAAFGGPMGAAGLGAVVGAQKYDEVKDREDMSDAMKLVDASSTAFWESFFEYIGTKQMADYLRKKYASVAKDKVEDEVKGVITGFLGKAYKKLGVWFAPVHEGTSEFATQVAQNLTAKYTGEDPNRSPWNGAIDSFLVGMGMGGVSVAVEQGMEQIPKYYQSKISGEPAPQETGPLDVPDEVTEQLAAEQTINQYGELLKFGRQPFNEDPEPQIIFGMNKKDGRKLFLTNSKVVNNNSDDNVYTTYDAEALKESNYDFNKVKQEFIKGSDIQERKIVPYAEWFQSEMDEFMATRAQLEQMGQNIQAQAQAPVQEGQTINLEGKDFNVTSVTTEGISLNEIDKDGNITGATMNITPDQYAQVFNLPQSQTTGIQQPANQPQNALQAPINQGIQQQVPAQPQAPAQQQQPRTLIAGKNEFSATPNEQGILTIDQVFETEADAQTTLKALEKKYEKALFKISKIESEDFLTPDEYRITLEPRKKPAAPQTVQQAKPAEPQVETIPIESVLNPEFESQSIGDQTNRVKSLLTNATGLKFQPSLQLDPAIGILKSDQVAAERFRKYVNANPVEVATTPDGKKQIVKGQEVAYVLSQLGMVDMPFKEVEYKEPEAQAAPEMPKDKTLADYPEDFQQFVNDVLITVPDLYSVMLRGLSNEQRSQAANDIKEGKISEASKRALDELQIMFQSGGITVWDKGSRTAVGISRDEIQAEIDKIRAEKNSDILNNYSYLDADELLEKGLITKKEYNEITDYIQGELARQSDDDKNINAELLGNKTGGEEKSREATDREEPEPERKPEVAPPLQKAVWQMTREEFWNQPDVQRIYGRLEGKDKDAYLSLHKVAIEEALAAGESVSPEVLADYPELLKPSADLTKANTEVNTQPTEAQKKAGNYKKGHLSVQGFDITIENPAMSVRSGIDRTGRKWSQMLNNSYGYFRRTNGKDGDQVDVFLGDNLNSDSVYVIDQVDPETGLFDEHKVMLGFNSAQNAKDNYYGNYELGWKGLGAISKMSIDQFKDWLGSGTRTRKPVDGNVPVQKKAESKPAEFAGDLFNQNIGGTENAERSRKTDQEVAPQSAPGLEQGEIGGRNLRNDEQGRLVEQPEQAEAPEVKPEIIDKITKSIPEDFKKHIDNFRSTGKMEEFSIGDTKIYIYDNSISKFPTAYDHMMKHLFINLDGVPDHVGALIGTKSNEYIDAYYAFLHESSHIKDKENPISQEDWNKYYNAPQEKRARDMSDKWLRPFVEPLVKPEIKPEEAEVPAEVKPETKEKYEEAIQKPAGQPATEQKKPEEPAVVEKTGKETKGQPAEFAGEIIEKPEVKEEAKPSPLTTEPQVPERKEPDYKSVHGQKNLLIDLAGSEEVAENIQDRILELRKIENPKSSQLTELHQQKLAYETVFARVEKLKSQVDNTIIPADKVEKIKVLIRENNVRNTIIGNRIIELQGKRKAKEKSLQKRNELLGDRKAEEEKKAGEQALFAGDKLFAPESGNLIAALKPFNDAIQQSKEEIRRNDQLLDEQIDLVIKGTQQEIKYEEPQKPEPEEPKATVDQTPLEKEEDGSEEQEEQPISEEEADEENQQFLESEGEANKITDFGKKIGAARKDLATSKEVEDLKNTDKTKVPRWMKDWDLGLQEDGMYSPFKSKTLWGNYRRITYQSKTTYPTAEEAAQAIKTLEVASKFKVREDRRDGTFFVYKWTGMKHTLVIKTGFKSQEEGIKWIVENVDYLLKFRPQFPERPHLDKIDRTGPEYRTGNVNTKQFQETFGFTGGEFGNWIPQDERQTILNMAYDGLMDLATALNVPVKALSLNGQLSIAFGARGHGGKISAAAHYERDRAVFNLTRINGAGSVAHEWLHALDNYFGMQDKGKTLERTTGGTVTGISGRDKDFLSHGTSYNSQVRKEVVDAFNNVMATMSKQPKIVEVDVAKKEENLANKKRDMQHYLTDARNRIVKGREYYGRKKARPGASEEVLKKFDDIVDRINIGDYGEIVEYETKEKYLNKYKAYSTIVSLNDIVKEVVGYSLLKRGAGLYNANSYANVLNALEKEIGELKKDNKVEKLLNTQYFNDAKEIDGMRGSSYWSTPHEMAARAFEAFVDDKIKESGNVSQYLVHSTDGGFYKALYSTNPYPEGVERKSINKAFDELFKTIQTKEEGGRVAMFRVVGEEGAKGLDDAENVVSNLIVAKQMKEKDLSAKQIFMATGWEVGADSKWKHETRDIELKKDIDFISTLKPQDQFFTEEVPITDVVDDEELFNSYPELRNIKLTFYNYGSNYDLENGGFVNIKKKTIAIGTRNLAATKQYPLSGRTAGSHRISIDMAPRALYAYDRSSLISGISHEIQHFIQRIEGFAEGSTKGNGGDNGRGDILYQKSAGEVEARNVQRRLGFTQEERRQRMLTETEDVNGDQQIVIRDQFNKQLNAGAWEHSIIKRALELEEYFNTPIQVVHSTVGLPLNVQNSIKAKGLENSSISGTYDPKTGMVYVVLDELRGMSQNEAIEEMSKTVLHEIVAHKGLPFLLGENNYNELLDDIYVSMSADDRSQFRELYNTGNARTIASEYLASMAEKNVNPNLFQRIIAKIRQLLRKLFGINYSDNDIHVMLRRSRENLQKPSYEFVGEHFETVPQFKVKQAPSQFAGEYLESDILTNAAERYKEQKSARKGKEVVQGFREYIQDINLPVRYFEEAVLKMGGRQDNESKPYRDSSLAFGRQEKLYTDYFEQKMKPVLESIAAIKKAGVSGEEILPYIISKHAAERNPVFRAKELAEYMDANPNAKEEQIDAVKEKLKNKDYSGVMQFDSDKDGKSRGNYENPDELANDIITAFEKKVNDKLINDLWKNVKEATNTILNTWKVGNQISQEQREEYLNRFKYYVPLRGWREGAAKELVYTHGEGFSKSMQHAEGRKSLADNPLAYLLQVEFQAIAEQVDNEVKSSMLKLVVKNLNIDEIYDLATVKKLYYVKVKNADGSFEWEATIDRPSAEMFANDEARVKIYREHERLRARRNAKEHEVIVHKPGGDLIIVFKGKQLPTGQALNKQNYMYRSIFGGVADARIDPQSFLAKMAALNNMLKATYTSWNIVFPFTNFMRDFLEASITQSIKYGAGTKTVANYKGAFPAIARRMAGKPDMKNKTDRDLEEFYNLGGATGYTHNKSIEEIEKDVNKAIKRMVRRGTATGSAINVLHGIGTGIEYWNRLFEDATRFSVYLSSIAAGNTKEDAAFDAKEASVNFNRKGKGSKSWDAWFAFFNVAVQSMQKNFKLAKDFPKAFSSVAFSFVMLGFLEALMNALTDDDDEDSSYYNINPYMRQNYLVIPNIVKLIRTGEKGDKYLSIPLPQFWRGFKSMGAIAFDIATGKMKPGTGVMEALGNFGAALLPVDVGGFYRDGEFSFAPLVPTIIKPIVEVAENKNYMGYKIKNEPFTLDDKKYLANAGLGKKNVSPAAKFMTDLLFRWGGGENKYKYYYNENQVSKKVPFFMDINPSTVEHLFKGYTGGTGGVLSDLVTTIAQSSADEVIDFRNVPFVNRFIRKTPEGKWNIISEYYDNRDDARIGSRIEKDTLKKAEETGDYSKVNAIYGDDYIQQYKEIFRYFEGEIDDAIKIDKSFDIVEGSNIATDLMKECNQAIATLKTKYGRK